MNALVKLIAIVLPIVCGSAHAGYLSSTKLMQILEEDMRGGASYDVGIATGYVMGVHDLSEGVLVCTPEGATLKQLKQVVFNYMKENPELWSSSADATVVKALASVWPCANRK